MRSTANDLSVEHPSCERLGKFKTLRDELAFCFSIMTSQMMAEYFISGFNVILPTLSRELEIPEASAIWPASVFALTAGSSLLFFGRLADMYGGYIVYTVGLAWHMIWALIAGFSQNELMMNFSRAFQGFGLAAFLSAGLMLLGSIYPPGRRKNVVFSIYGACAPIGFFLGIFSSGLAGQYLSWRWYFWIGAILISLSLGTALFYVPNDFQYRRQVTKSKVQMDWLGAACFIPGLVLVTFAITDSAHAPDKWKTPYIYICLIAGILILAAGIYVEGWVAKDPLLPFELFAVPQMKPLLLALFFSYGVLGIWLLYVTFYAENVLMASPLRIVAWFVPFGLGGLFFSLIGGMILHLVPGTILLVIAGIGWILAPLLIAIAPIGASYWEFTFPAMICGTLGVDITYNITNIFLTTSLPVHQQGLAGAVANSILFLGISFFLGFADFTAGQVIDKGTRKTYQAALWFAVGCASVAVVLLLAFVKIDKAKSEAATENQFEITEETKVDNKLP